MSLTVFTIVHNHANTLRRVYESLSTQTVSDNFEWLVIDNASSDFTLELVDGFIRESRIPIKYIPFADMSPLYECWKKAYSVIESDLSFHISPECFLPDNIVELTLSCWAAKGSGRYTGIAGLIYEAETDSPTGGHFPDDMESCFLNDLKTRGIHRGEVATVMRSDLVRKALHDISGTARAKYFSPEGLFLQICDTLPLLVIDRNLLYIDRFEKTDMPTDSIQRHKILAELSRQQMCLRHSTPLHRMRAAIVYIYECIHLSERRWLSGSPRKLMTLAAALPGLLLYAYRRLLK